MSNYNFGTSKNFLDKWKSLSLHNKNKVVYDFLEVNNYNLPMTNDDEFFELAFNSKYDVAKAIYKSKYYSVNDTYALLNFDGTVTSSDDLEELCGVIIDEYFEDYAKEYYPDFFEEEEEEEEEE